MDGLTRFFPRNPRGKDKRAMIQCPATGKAIFTGVTMDEAAFNAVTIKNYEVNCSECGQKHRWSKEDANLTEIQGR